MTCSAHLCLVLEASNWCCKQLGNLRNGQAREDRPGAGTCLVSQLLHAAVSVCQAGHIVGYTLHNACQVVILLQHLVQKAGRYGCFGTSRLRGRACAWQQLQQAQMQVGNRGQAGPGVAQQLVVHIDGALDRCQRASAHGPLYLHAGRARAGLRQGQQAQS